MDIYEGSPIPFFVSVFGIVMTVVKAFGGTDWTWFWCIFPIWAPLAPYIVIYSFIFVIAVIASAGDFFHPLVSRKEKMHRKWIAAAESIFDKDIVIDQPNKSENLLPQETDNIILYDQAKTELAYKQAYIAYVQVMKKQAVCEKENEDNYQKALALGFRYAESYYRAGKGIINSRRRLAKDDLNEALCKICGITPPKERTSYQMWDMLPFITNIYKYLKDLFSGESSQQKADCEVPEESRRCRYSSFSWSWETIFDSNGNPQPKQLHNFSNPHNLSKIIDLPVPRSE